MQNGILKSFAPLLQEDGTHSKKDELYKFVVKIDEKGSETKGVALAQHTTGSKRWKLNANHEYTRIPNDYSPGGYFIKGLKCTETTNTQKPGSPQSFDMKKESYVVSRFAHQFALDYLNTLPEKEREKLMEDLGSKEIVSKLSKTMAGSVHKIALEVQKMDEGGNREAS